MTSYNHKNSLKVLSAPPWPLHPFIVFKDISGTDRHKYTSQLDSPHITKIFVAFKLQMILNRLSCQWPLRIYVQGVHLFLRLV